MSNIIIENIAKPLASRVGTALSAWLIAQGVNYSHAENIALGLVAVALVSVDLVSSYFSRKKLKGK